MISGRRRVVSAALALAALGSPACAGATPLAEFQVVVYNCYTTTDVRVFIDGSELLLIPPARRQDSIALCHSGAARLGPRVRIELREGGQIRRVELSTSQDMRFLHITPGVAPYAHFERAGPLLD